jgi:hypothetical protein
MHQSEYAMNPISALETLRCLPKPYVRNQTKPRGLGVIVILFTVLIGATLPDAPEEIIHVPIGKPVMVDGKIEPDEWSDAAELKMPNGARLCLKRAGEFVYVAVQFPVSRSGFTDLYISPEDGSIYDLHASAKLGERQMQSGKWPEWNIWWNNRGWVANVSRVDSFEKKTFLPANVREYQIQRSRFHGHEWRLMLNMSLESRGDEYTVQRFPKSASDSNPEKWLRVQMEP